MGAGQFLLLGLPQTDKVPPLVVPNVMRRAAWRTVRCLVHSAAYAHCCTWRDLCTVDNSPACICCSVLALLAVLHCVPDLTICGDMYCRQSIC